jgi:tetratricopeptide (TPR) repeat protein
MKMLRFLWPTWSVFLAAVAGAFAQPPTFSELVLQGFAHEQKQDYAAAFEDYTAALKLNEESPTVYVRRAYAAAKLGQLERAAMDLREANLLTPVTMTDYTTMAWLLATCPVKAIRDGTRSVAFAQKAFKESESAETYDILAAAYAEMGNFQRARNLLLEGMKKYPDSPRIPAMKKRLALYNEKKPFRDVWLENSDQKKLQNRVEFPQ